MKISVKEIADLVKGRLSGDGSRIIDGVAGLTEAKGSEISFLKDTSDKELMQTFESSKAGCVFVPNGLSENGKTLIAVDHPLAAFSKVLSLLDREKNSAKPGVHPMSSVDSSAVLGKNVSIGAFTVIEAGVVIGDGSRIGAQVYIGARTKVGSETHIYPQVTIREDNVIGDRCILHPGCVIGADGFGFYFVQGKHNKIPQVGNVIIENDVEIGAGSAIDRATTGSTRIRQGVKIDNLVQVAHNVDVGELTLLVAQVGIGGSCKIGKGVVMAGQAGMADHMTLGDGVQVGGQGGVTRDIPAGSVVWGTPAIPLGQRMREIVLLKKLPKLFQKTNKS